MSAIDSELNRMVEQPINYAVQNLAAVLVERHSIRSLDAIQLASAMTARETAMNAIMLFVGSDDRLNETARPEGFRVWDPAA